MGRLDGKVALITGGARGQGAAEARLFAREGAKVVFGDIRDELGQKVEEEIQELGGDATYVHLDVTRTPDWEQVIALAESKYGKLDVLVNNAAILIRKEIEDTTSEDWDQIMDVNAKSCGLSQRRQPMHNRVLYAGRMLRQHTKFMRRQQPLHRRFM